MFPIDETIRESKARLTLHWKGVIVWWKLKNSYDKQILFIECPFVSDNRNILIFQNMGFTITSHQLWCSELDTIIDILDRYELTEFDIILICVSGNPRTSAERGLGLVTRFSVYSRDRSRPYAPFPSASQ